MEAIPELQDSQFGITITRRYQGEFEVSISYAGQYIKRYPLSTVADLLLRCIVSHIPLIGFWLFSREAREKMIRKAYLAALEDFIQRLKIDTANAIFGQESQ